MKPAAILPLGVYVWWIVIVAVTVVLMLRMDWWSMRERSMLRITRVGRLIVALYGAMFLSGLAAIIVAFARL